MDYIDIILWILLSMAALVALAIIALVIKYRQDTKEGAEQDSKEN